MIIDDTTQVEIGIIYFFSTTIQYIQYMLIMLLYYAYSAIITSVLDF